MNQVSEKTRSMDLNENSPLLEKERKTLTPISINLAEHLFELSKSVVKDNINPKTVHAACACASEIHKLLSLAYKHRK